MTSQSARLPQALAPLASLTSSVLVAAALGMRPDGVPSRRACRCVYCGLAIAEGDLSAPFHVTSGFMDDLSLASRGSGLVCGYCAVLTNKEVLAVTSHGVYSFDGVAPFRKWADIGRALADPPHGPFCAGYATSNNQHMAWRMPVNFSRERFYVRVGLRDLCIRRPVLLRAMDACERLGSFMGVSRTEKSLPHPFKVLSNDLKGQGAVAHAKLRLRKNSEELGFKEAALALPEDAALIRSLSLGETWALRFLLSPGAGSDSVDPSAHSGITHTHTTPHTGVKS